MKIFRGHPAESGPALVTVDDGMGEKLLDPKNELVNHSPDGFQWGYGGSGPAQLALAICANVFGDQKGLAVYMDYKWRVIAGLPRAFGWEIYEEDVRKIVQQIGEARK